MPRLSPDWRRLDAFDWSVLRAAWAVSLTFWPLLSAEVAARATPSRAVRTASSALAIATWPNTPALCDDALMFSLPPMPPRI
ncbi:hypothetical protein L6E12_01685 [Actinokineospora sp. PR83]|uniref:hypothetical protein n=1 Tax=Actinokineospora sp. PR83 TaxID=2884908 RepID=UPI001F437F5A|nr:hypothetical protein [Actinokineospora sp. PR83]MCG8914506.1 hypothetical protein [Actinokineospora sp. PR83]